MPIMLSLWLLCMLFKINAVMTLVKNSMSNLIRRNASFYIIIVPLILLLII